MSVVFPINENPRFGRYIATAGQTIFAIPFPFQGDNDVAVFKVVNGLPVQIAQSDYAITGKGQPAGGTIVFSAGRLLGDVILIVGQAVLTRLGSIVAAGRFSSSLSDDEFDRNRIIQQELARDAQRALKADFGQVGLILDADLSDGDTLMKVGGRLVKGANATDIAHAQENAAVAQQARDEAVASKVAAEIAEVAILSSVGSIKPASFFDIRGIEQGVTVDQRAKLQDAYESGFKFDGRYMTFNADGNIRPGALKGIRDTIIYQLNPNADGRRTIDLRNLSGFELQNVVVDGGGIFGYAGSDQPVSNRGMAFLYQCSDFTVRGYGAKNGGPGNGLALEGCTDFGLYDINIRDLAYDVPAVVNDWIDGILINGCDRGVLNGFRVRNLKGKIGGVDKRQWTRGVTIGNNKNLTIGNGLITVTDVGLDMTGGTGNENVAIDNMALDDQYTWGYKFANCQRKIVGRNLISRYAGLSSFVFNAPVASGISLGTVTQDIELDGIIGYNPGATTDVLDEGSGNLVRNGVTIMPSSAEYTLYPQGIRIKNALMIDDRGAGAKMKYGYRNAQVHPGTAGHKRNEVDDSCKSQGHVTARQIGFHYPRVIVTSSNTAYSLSPSGSFVDLGWNVEIEDSCNAHSISSNVEQVKILEDGWYQIGLTVEFAANATGRRGVRFRTASPAFTYPAEWNMAINGGVSTLTMNWEGPLVAGSVAIAQAMQESGGALNANLNGSRFSVTKIGDI